MPATMSEIDAQERRVNYILHGMHFADALTVLIRVGLIHDEDKTKPGGNLISDLVRRAKTVYKLDQLYRELLYEDMALNADALVAQVELGFGEEHTKPLTERHKALREELKQR